MKQIPVLCLVWLLISCSASGPLQRADLLADPAAALRLPDADDLAHVGGDRIQGLDGESPAFEGHIYGTYSAASAVNAFYTRELDKLGWLREGELRGTSTTELGGWWWCKSRATVRLAIKKPNAYEPSLYRGKSYTTVFDARIIANSAGEAPCPTPSPAGSP